MKPQGTWTDLLRVPRGEIDPVQGWPKPLLDGATASRTRNLDASSSREFFAGE
ncbi:MAG: hypothetical protein ABI633_12170 [Burkholderiales bacterium]